MDRIAKYYETKLMEENLNAIEQAQMIYPMLVQAASKKTTVTYNEVNRALGYKKKASGQIIRFGMDIIVLYCKEADHPQLTSLIVNKGSRVPTGGYAYGDGEDIPEEHSKCFRHQWESSFDYKGIWDRRVELRKKYNFI